MRRAFAVLLLAFAAPALFGQADQEVVSVVDSPDPVTPGATLTYTITMTNHGPNPAVNGGFNTNLPGQLTYVGTTAPAGFTCGTFGAAVSCTNPSFAPGTVVFTMTSTVGAHLANFPDSSFSTAFSPSGVTPDPNSGNNNKTATTALDSPQVDLSVAVTDSPDPVFPNGDITYTILVTNGGPDPATSVNFNSFNNGTLKYQSITIPAGWSCPSQPAVNGNPTFTCTRASFPAGNSTFTVVVRADPAVLGINDGTVSIVFGVNGTGNDTNNGNNQEQENTAYVTPDADMQVSATDSPDPVAPDGDITYTVTVTNAGPDTAPNATMNVPMNGTLRFRSVTTPAGWTCTPPAVDGGTSWGCTNPSVAAAASSVFTIVLRANDEQFGIHDQTINQVFTAGSSIADPNNGNNVINVSTAYVTPDADMQVTATDSPDPVMPDGDITYTVTVTNAGPNTAPNVTMNVPMNGTLRFRSVTTPAGWTCTPPAVDGGTSWGCTNPSFGLTSSVFTIVLRANDEQFGIHDQTINQVFTAGSSIADPNNANNVINVTTQYSTPDANLAVTATDSPDPVTNGSNLTYAITVSNAGPDAGPNTQVTAAVHPSLTFQSIAAPAGWSCTTPAVNASGSVICTHASFPSAGSANFTLVTKLVASGAGGTISSTFGVGSAAQDPVNTNNSIQVFTNWIGQTTDLSISKTSLTTAVAQGGTITYTISTINNGPDTATNVTVTDVLPSQLRFQSITAPAGWSCTTPAAGANGTITCTTPLLLNGASANFTLVTTVAPTATGTISNSAAVGGGGSDPTPGNSSGSSSGALIAGNSDLVATKTTAATTVAPGGSISYTINVRNDGPDPAASVVMTDVLPASLRFQSITAPAGWSCTTPAVGANGTVTCNAATLANGATATFTLVATAAPNATGTITNSASASHSGTDGNGGNSSGSSPATPVDLSGTADLFTTKTTATTSVAPGQTFSYTISVRNDGPGAATNVVMNDILPASLLFQSIATPAGFTCTTPAAGANGTVNCTGATLANGATATFTLTVRVAAGATGSIINSVTTTATQTDPNPGNSNPSSPALPIGPASADLSLAKSTTSTSFTQGSTITYTITVNNAGPSTATNTVVTDVLPTGLTLVSATPSQGSCSGTTTLTCNLGTLNSLATATITINATVTASSGTITNSATVTAAETDPNGGNNNGSTPPIPVVPSGAGVAQIPTLSEWALIGLAMLLMAFAVRKI